ncbi:hypothetical protein BU16DRAFT_522255 [Lophium mytilinum]|uniref:DUF8004 domain-containing protein n=1 Tax=Lophium mytilinum TaxID=390894 RepID=A0A6A6R9U2_9PEZI|nr:hypothetical protein BU16DRAFT_522255 [Lophium mytilinum]
MVERPPVPSRCSSLRSRSASSNSFHSSHDSQDSTSNGTNSSSREQAKPSTQGQIPAVSRVSLDGPSLDLADILAEAKATQSLKLDSVPNFSRVRTSANFDLPEDVPEDAMAPMRVSRRAPTGPGAMRNPTRQEKVKRWDGETKTVEEWDGLRRDHELWYEHGDCHVHLYARGASRRGPSFRVPFKALRDANCGAMFSLCFAQMAPETPGSPSSRIPTKGSCDLYIPAPDESSREASFQWHLTTRNFFAFVLSKPLVGTHLGKTLVDLQERMHLFRSGQINNHEDFLVYIDDMGYRNFVDTPDYALSMLYYAEHYQLRDLWVDAFAHCVGMNDRLCLSPEFEHIRRVTKALITRAYLEMDLHLGRVAAALSHFLEDDLSASNLGLSQGARAHLDRFRSFLQSFYVEKFGYWPPPEGASYSKSLYRSMYFDFRSLYDYLVDVESADTIQTQKPASGGICVLQNVHAFDRRHKFTPLPHPLPRLPFVSSQANRTQSQRALVAFKLGSKNAKTDVYLTTRAALTAATNTTDISVTTSPLVVSYMRFERECAVKQREEKVSIADARKVRWLLIYGALQILISAIRAPKEVRDTEEANYPLCCLVAGTPPWKIGANALRTPVVPSANATEAFTTYLSEVVKADEDSYLTDDMTPLTNIQPDCEMGDYFTHTNNDVGSTSSLQHQLPVEVPAPLRVAPPLLRNTSIKSMKQFAVSRFSRRNSVLVKAPTQPFCEIIVHGYGNGLNQTIIDPPSSTASPRSESPQQLASVVPTISMDPSPTLEASGRSVSSRQSRRATRPMHLELNCDSLPDMERTPTLDTFQIDGVQELNASGSASTSSDTSSPMTPVFSRASSTSSASSYGPSNQEVDSKAVSECSNVLGGLVSMDSPTSKYSSVPNSPVSPTARGRKLRFSFGSASSDAAPIYLQQVNRAPSLAGFDFGLDGTSETTPSLKHSPSIDSYKIPTEAMPQLLRHSISLESFDTMRKAAPAVDIYAALQMLPRSATSQEERIEEYAEESAPSPSVSTPPQFANKVQKPKLKKRLSLRMWG